MTSAPPPQRFSIGPLTRAIDAADFCRWLEIAPAGARIEYAEGPVEPRGFPVWEAVKKAVASGAVTPHRTIRGTRTVFLAVRCPPRAPSSRVAPGIDSESDEGRVLALLAREAGAGRPCPTHSVIAIALGMTRACDRRTRITRGQRPAERVRYLIGKLCRAGVISVEQRGRGLRPIVTVVRTGQQRAADGQRAMERGGRV